MKHRTAASSPLVAATIYVSEDDDSDTEPTDAHDTPLRHRREPLRGCALASIVCVVASALAAGGALEIMAADREYATGWTLGLCRIERVFNDTANCEYCGVVPIDAVNRSSVLCAVPSAIASAAAFYDPPACTINDATEHLVWWHTLAPGTEVECYVPSTLTAAVTLDACTASTTGSHSVSTVVWRMWIERLVYVMRSHAEGAAALAAVTARRKWAGVGVLVCGLLLGTCVVACACACAYRRRRLRQRV